MLASGFTNAPVSKGLLFGLVASSIAVSLMDSKHLLYINIVPHLWPYRQIWRLGVWQLAYTNSTSLLFSSMALYHMRLIERLWGPRKFASFLFTLYPLTAFFPPFLLALALRPLSFNLANTVPAGPTALVFALLAQYQAAIPTVYKWRLVTGAGGDNASGRASGQAPEGGESGTLNSVLTFSDKTTTYLLAMQLALSQLPGSALSALVGYGLGVAYRNGVLPERLVEWRLPGWLVGGSGMVGRREGEGFEDLRRRLEGEGRASGIDASQGGEVRAR